MRSKRANNESYKLLPASIAAMRKHTTGLQPLLATNQIFDSNIDLKEFLCKIYT